MADTPGCAFKPRSRVDIVVISAVLDMVRPPGANRRKKSHSRRGESTTQVLFLLTLLLNNVQSTQPNMNPTLAVLKATNRLSPCSKVGAHGRGSGRQTKRMEHTPALS